MRLDSAGFKLNPCHSLVLSVLRNSMDSISDFSDPDPQNSSFFIFLKVCFNFFLPICVHVDNLCVYVCAQATVDAKGQLCVLDWLVPRSHEFWGTLVTKPAQ